MFYQLFTIFFVVTNIAFSMVLEPPMQRMNGWKEIGQTDSQQHIKLHFAIKNENIDILKELFISVSTPGNGQYGNHRSIPELRSLIAPSNTAIRSMMNFLSDYNINIESSNHDLLSVMTTISEAQILLNCTYFDYQSLGDKSLIISRLKLGTTYQINENIGKHLYFISPTIRFPDNKIFPKLEVFSSSKNTPPLLKALYNVGSAKGVSSNNSQGIASFETEFYDPSDLKMMWNTYNISACNVTNIPSNSSNGDALEAELDTQYISSLGESIPMQVWLTEGRKFLDDLYNFTQNVLNSSNPPDLFSISYGVVESDISQSYLNKLNTQFMLMGTAGISVLFASGDSGAGGGCVVGQEPFQPTWPASSPYVTAVGGVYKGTVGQSPTGEESWAYGGGGFSNIEPIQAWQTEAVSYYLSNGKYLPPVNLWNQTGRGFPDIAAQSVDFEIYVKGKTKMVSGTSCASPTAGGIFALLNDLRKQNKMAPMGFLNPFIYQIAAKDPLAFNDVTKGTNYGCSNVDGIGYQIGFPAFEKWDATTGFGTPNYAKLKNYVLQTGLQTLRHNKL